MAGTAVPSNTIVTVAPAANRMRLMRKFSNHLRGNGPKSCRVLMRLDTKWNRIDDASLELLLLLLLLLLTSVHSCLAHA